MAIELITCPACKGWGDDRGTFNYCSVCGGMGTIPANDD